MSCDKNTLPPQTTNERINGSKYSWMVDGDGNYCNRYFHTLTSWRHVCMYVCG